NAYPLVGYKTTKAAVVALTENLAAANAQYGVRANTILPGLMNTPMAIEARVAKGPPREDVIASRDRRVPLRRRMGTGWDVAYAALYLHSDEAGFVTGVSLAVDGGEGVSWGVVESWCDRLPSSKPGRPSHASARRSDPSAARLRPARLGHGGRARRNER